jgi:hypothetical protein
MHDMVPCSTVTQETPLTVPSKKNGPTIPVKDNPHHTDIAGTLTASSSVACGFCPFSSFFKKPLKLF